MIVAEIQTFNDVLEFIDYSERIGNAHLWFRGVDNSEYKLIPSVARNTISLEREQYIVNDFYTMASQVLPHSPDKKDYAGWMCLMQHYGLPTRLLDWSTSPLIALFFAVEKEDEQTQHDACIWVLAPRKLNAQQQFGEYVYPSDAITAQHMLIPAFKNRGYDKSLLGKILACSSVVNNPRLYAQQACFTIHNSAPTLESICTDDMLFKMIIPTSKRGAFKAQLAALGISERYVYPDLDHISRDIKLKYHIM